MKTVFMFSGQGAQYAGMGKELYENFAQAREVFDCANETLGYNIKEVCFTDEELLSDTEFAQPAILTMSIAAMRVLKEQGVRAEMTAGLSLGEYSAYVASGAMDFAEAVELVQKRGKFMSEAFPAGKGAMYAIIGLERVKVEQACDAATAIGEGIAVPANYNAPGQIVIAGEADAAERAAAIAKDKGAKMTVKLKVSGPFHTKLLRTAAIRLRPELDKLHLSKMQIPVYTNLTAGVVDSPTRIPEILEEQVIHPVLWEDTVRNMAADGADTFIELGPGKTLSGFVKRTLKDVKIMNVEDLSSLDKTLNALA